MSVILFDFDGTLADSGPIITRSLDWVMRTYSGIDNGPDFYKKYVGPPLPQTFAELGVTDIPEYTRLYRSHYIKLMGQTKLFPGIAPMLERLGATGVPLAIATSKREDTAVDLITQLGIAQYFTVICGSDPCEENGTKADRIREALDQLTSQGIATSEALMVGDRIFDIEGARTHTIPTILVRWGDAPQEELAQAWRVAESVDELEEMLLEFSGFAAWNTMR